MPCQIKRREMEAQKAEPESCADGDLQVLFDLRVHEEKDTQEKRCQTAEDIREIIRELTDLLFHDLVNNRKKFKLRLHGDGGLIDCIVRISDRIEAGRKKDTCTHQGSGNRREDDTEYNYVRMQRLLDTTMTAYFANKGRDKSKDLNNIDGIALIDLKYKEIVQYIEMHNKIRSLLLSKNNTILAGSVFSVFQTS